jgi:hypothetical protein
MKKSLASAVVLCLGTLPGHANPEFKVHGQAWTDFGRIMKASDSLLPSGDPNVVLNMNGNTLASLGAQFTVKADLAEHWEGAFGFGAHKVNHAMGHGQKAFLTIAMFHNFLTESRLTWYAGEKENPDFSVTLGSFPYKYNQDVHNLGLYLFRGPVYPGILMGGFQDFAVDPSKSTQLGAKVHHAVGNFSHDVILNTERDIPPTFDWSLGYVAKYNAFGALEVGAGVNFYRLLAYDEKLQTPGKLSDADLNFGPRDRFIEVDTAGSAGNPALWDTTYFTHQGTKLMGMFSLDFKPLLGLESGLTPNDFKLYGEGALLGWTNYGKTYADRSQRMPMMVGFNIPTFGILDRLSIEVERYTSPYRNDLTNLGNNNLVADWTIKTPQEVPIPSPKPVQNKDYGIAADGTWTDVNGRVIQTNGTGLSRESVTTDDIKWSLLVEKTVSGHIRFLAQVANDHYRPRPVATGLIASSGGVAEAFSEQSNWYFMLRMGYFF